MPFAWALVHWGNAYILGLAILLVFLIGLWATARHMTATQNPDDPSEVVIDEVAGVWVACLALPDASAGGLIGAFLLLLTEGRASGLYLALGFLSLALGLGFSNAAVRLRDILNSAPKPQIMDEEATSIAS